MSESLNERWTFCALVLEIDVFSDALEIFWGGVK